MSTTVQVVYDRICNRLLENGGFQTGTFTEAQFLLYFSDVLFDFLKRTGIIKLISTQSITAGTSQYTIPEEQLATEYAFFNGTYLARTNQNQLDQSVLDWPNKLDTPARWYEDGLPIKTIGLFPNPSQNGVGYAPISGSFQVGDRNLTTYGAQMPSQVTFALGDTIPLVPDCMVQYLTWGVLRKIWSDDSEMKDNQRAAYAAARFEEGLSLGKAALLEELCDDYEEIAS